jgi:hypothetical protein
MDSFGSASPEPLRPRCRRFVLRQANAGFLAPQGRDLGDRELDLQVPKARNYAEEGSISDRASDGYPATRGGGLPIEAIITPMGRVQIASSSSASPTLELTRIDPASCPDPSADTRGSAIGPSWRPRSSHLDPDRAFMEPRSGHRDPASKLRDPGIEAYKFEFHVAASEGPTCPRGFAAWRLSSLLGNPVARAPDRVAP